MPLNSPNLPNSQTAVDLPAGLREQFGALARRLWKIETRMAASLAAGGLLGSFLAQCVSDRLWDTPVWLRCAITGAGIAAVLAAAAWWARRWVWRRRDLHALANLVQTRFRRLGDRLLGIVELADTEKRPAHFSPELYRAAIDQVAAEAAQFDFAAAVDARPARRRLRWVGALAAASALAALALPLATGNSFKRWAAPLASIPRFTLVSLEGLASEMIVAHGESFVVNATVNYRSFWKPARAVGQLEIQPRLEAPVKDQRVELRVPGQTQNGRLVVRVGDCQREVSVRPTHRPSLKELAASIQLPDYLRYPVLTQSVQSGALTMVEGSRATLTGRATRDLASAESGGPGRAAESLPVRGEEFSTAPLSAAGEVEFQWQDKLGLRAAAPWKLTIETKPDQPPAAEFLELPREVAILESEVLQLKAQARDDFGVRDLGVTWTISTDETPTNATAPSALRAEASSPHETKLAETFGFSPRLAKVPPDTVIELKAVARDFFPGRAGVESPVYRVQVLGNERHAEMLRQQLESLQARLEEATRLEEKIAEETRELKEMSADELKSDEAGESLAELAGEQLQNAKQLEQMARDGGKTLREAMRNPLMPEETLRDWARNLQQMQKLAQQNMRQAAKSLKNAQQNPEARAQETASALEQEQEALEALEQMQERVNKQLDQLQAMTLAQRLRKLGHEEKELEARLQKNIGETIGLTPKELPERFQRANTRYAEEQAGSQKEAQALQGEISRFFERTQKGEYGQVNKEMAEARAGEELDRVKGLIAENISMEAMQSLANWAERFDGWADLLEPKNKGGEGGGEGGGSAGGDDEMTEKLLKLLVGLLRMREDESNLREQTRLLDQRKEDGPLYVYNADLLATKERESVAEMFRMQRQAPFAVLAPVLAEAFGSMRKVEGLLARPETGTETRTAQSQTIDLLTDAINLINEQTRQQNGQSSSASAASEEMAFLMQMMAQGRGQMAGMSVPGKTAGGNTGGGSTDRAATSASGNASGKAGEGRKVDRASGFGGSLPTEFREALESYFNALEKEGE